MVYDNKAKIATHVGEHGDHPVGGAVGAALGAVAGAAAVGAAQGAALGTVIGLPGMAAGVAIGGVVGALAGKGVAQETNPTTGDASIETDVDPIEHADKDMKAVLDALASLKPKPIDTLSPDEARKQPSPADGAKLVMKNTGKDPLDSMGVTTRDITYSGAEGDLPARIYKPEGVSANDKLPVVVYYHGGGWVIADLDTYDASPRAIAKGANAIVVSVHYRQAPEHKFPAAHEDAVAAYKWVLKNAESFGGDAKRVAVMGESAGGNLAINVAIAAREQKLQMPAHQVLVYPVAGTDMTTASYKENAYAKPLNKAMMEWFVKHVIRTDKDKQDPRLDLIGYADLHGLPPATVITDQIDPLRSEGQTLADKLKQAGVEVNAKNYDGVTHEFFGMGAVVAKAKDAEALVSKDLKTAFAKQQ